MASSTPTQTSHTEEGESRGSRNLRDEGAGEAGGVSATEDEVNLNRHRGERRGTREAGDRLTECIRWNRGRAEGVCLDEERCVDHRGDLHAVDKAGPEGEIRAQGTDVATIFVTRDRAADASAVERGTGSESG